MNDGANPVVVFEQHLEVRDVVHADYYQRLIEEARK
jgi:hypothetical protein